MWVRTALVTVSSGKGWRLDRAAAEAREATGLQPTPGGGHHRAVHRGHSWLPTLTAVGPQVRIGFLHVAPGGSTEARKDSHMEATCGLHEDWPGVDSQAWGCCPEASEAAGPAILERGLDLSLRGVC